METTRKMTTTAHEAFLRERMELATQSSPASRASTYNLEIHVSNSGSDTTGDGSVQRPYKTIGHAFSLINQNGATFIYLAPGDYTNETAQLSRHHGWVVIAGEGSTSKVGTLNFWHCQDEIYIFGLDIQAIRNYGCSFVNITDCTFTHPTKFPSVGDGGTMRLSYCTISNTVTETPIFAASDGGQLIVDHCGGSNTKGLITAAAGTIHMHSNTSLGNIKFERDGAGIIVQQRGLHVT